MLMLDTGDSPVATRSVPVLRAGGRELSRVENPEIFAVLGETYGMGDGHTTFLLPDLRPEHWVIDSRGRLFRVSEDAWNEAE